MAMAPCQTRRGLTNYNLLLLLPLLLILMGIVGFVHQEKGKNDY